MKFILDENIPNSVRIKVGSLGADVEFIRDLIPEGSVDPLVAFVAENNSAILLSFDGDFQSIAPRIPNGQKSRFKRLSRIWLRCNEYQAAIRVEAAWDFIRNEFDIACNAADSRMHLTIGKSYIRSER